MSSHSFVDQNREDKYQFMSEHCQLSVIQFVNDVILKIKTQVHDIYKQQKIKKIKIHGEWLPKSSTVKKTLGNAFIYRHLYIHRYTTVRNTKL